MANIYELTADIQLLWNLMEEGEIEDDTLIDAMQNSQEELSIKLENYCKFIKNMEADAKAFKEEEQRLAARRKTLENTIERAKKAMQMAMDVAGEKKVQGKIFTISLQKNPASVVLDEQYMENIPEKYLIHKTDINKRLMAEDMKNGVDLEGLAHLEQSEGLRIR